MKETGNGLAYNDGMTMMVEVTTTHLLRNFDE